jgi:hypothetical protein
MARKACVSLPGSPQGVYVCLVRTLTLTVLVGKTISQHTPLHQSSRLPFLFPFHHHLTVKMPAIQGNGKAPNIANPNLPTAPSSKAPSVAGSTAATESAAVVAKDDPAKAIEKLEIRTKAVNTNNVARVANSHLTSSDAKLHPLVSLRTGKPLEKFPDTSMGLAKLTCKSFVAVLCWDWRIAVLLCNLQC